MEKEQRKIYLDFLRIVAIFMVLFNHSNAAGYMLFSYYEQGTWEHFLYLINSIFIKMGVPLFFMISGALLLGKKENIRQILKRFKKYLFILIVSSAITYIWSATRGGYYNGLSFKEFWKILYTGRHATAYWYLYVYLIYLLMLPFIRYIAQNIKIQEILFIILLYVILKSTVILDFLIWRGGIVHNEFINAFIFTDYILYPLFGYFIENKLDSKYLIKKNLILAIILSFGILVACTVLTDYRCNIIGSWSEKDCQLFFDLYVLIPSCTFFICIKNIFKKITLQVWTEKIIITAGSLTFGVYLFERIWRHETMFIYDVVKNYLSPLMSCWVWIFSACVIGSFTTWIAKRIPFLDRYI